MNLVARLSAASLILIACSAAATGLDKASTIEANTVKADAASQQRINRSDDAAQTMKAEIERLEREVENLTVYRNHLQNLITSQNEEQASLQKQLQDIAETRQGIVPLMYRMIEDLSFWVSTDLPMNKASREKRVEDLKTLMTRADVSDAEKLRRILEAYQIELDYGAKLGVFQQKLTLDGISREVDVLHLGRMALVAKSLKGDLFWYYDLPQKQWVKMDSADTTMLGQAFDVADERVPPSMLILPLAVSADSKEG